MQALYFEENGRLGWRDDPEVVLRSGKDAIVRPVASTTCDLDQAIIHGRTPFPPGFALGHECVAEVVEIGDQVSDVVPGDIVVVPCAPSCGVCDVCRAGMTASCEAIGRHVVYGTPFGAAVGGLFSDKVWVPFADAMLVKVPEGVNPIAVSGASDSLTDTYINVTKGLKRHPGGRVLVWGGVGKLGPYAVDLAIALGAGSVDYVDTDEKALTLAEEFGARVHRSFDPAWDWTFDVVVFAAWQPSELRQAFTGLRAGGHLSQLMIFFEDTPIPMMEIYLRDLTFSNGRPSSRPQIPHVLEHCRSGDFHPERVVSKIIDFDDAPEALVIPTLMPVVVRQPTLSSRRLSIADLQGVSR
jgi:alcohol dehydrogenase